MTDKVQKIREEVEKLKSQLLRGVCASQIAMETRCKEEAYNEVLAILDTMQEEPVSEDLEEALAREWKGYNDRGAATVDALEDNSQELAFAKGFYRGSEWGKNQAKVEIQAQSMALAHGCPKEPARGLTKEVVKGASTGGMLIKVPQSTLDTLDIVAGDKINIQIRKV